MYDEEGIIELVREMYGFVRLKRYPSESACFLKDDEARYLGRRIKCATDVFKVGDVVRFDAIPNERGKGVAKWRITTFHYIQSISGWAPPKPCRDWYSNGSDKVRALTGCDGVVDRVKSEYGFIRLGPHSTPAAFFRVGVLEQSIEKSIKDVSEVLAVGDLVRFDAELNLKENTSAKWWITYIRPVSPTPGSLSREDVGKSSGGEHPRGSGRGPRDVGGRDSDTDDGDNVSDVYQNALLSVKRGEKKALPWSYARCAARAVADEGVPAAGTSAPKVRPTSVTSTTSTVSKMMSFLARPSILVYCSVRGIVKRVDGDAVAECEVRETGSTRRIRFGEFCPLYRNGVRVLGSDGVKSLGKGDQLTLDYAVATDVTAVKDADVHCYLAWQGERPCDVPHLIVALLSRALKVGCEESGENTARTDAPRNHGK
ncbi:uncharacterized protein LOC142776405 [Rhipicephalus microplus]|uniref:uncharacterized protein LOC142776405 n=1 Tax=Rhipicephalus microplus TaxID=6941 RepID=UPI003F6BDBD4